MIQALKEAIIGLLGNCQKTFIAVMLIILAFPVLMVGYFLARDVGIIQDVHTQLVTTSMEQTNKLQTMNHMISESLYYQQRTCINTATTDQKQDECIKPRFQRRMDRLPREEP